ncbi:unnamed protein product [Cuscuta europaea]|uniref:Uncharacterized protein n=1 Tax=Cuscuta europaea TaxID=41803 RepID=A0A9P0ZAT3_CUSEU|nr:unnamed protein product [Cuscuta europaea]
MNDEDISSKIISIINKGPFANAFALKKHFLKLFWKREMVLNRSLTYDCRYFLLSFSFAFKLDDLHLTFESSAALLRSMNCCNIHLPSINCCDIHRLSLTC